MPAPADCAIAPGSAPLPSSSGMGGPAVNPRTGLSTDYLNHFTEAVMMIEMIATVPECLHELAVWQPRTYPEHFAASRFSNRDALITAYWSADPAIRLALDRVSEVLNALIERSRELVIQ